MKLCFVSPHSLSLSPHSQLKKGILSFRLFFFSSRRRSDEQKTCFKFLQRLSLTFYLRRKEGEASLCCVRARVSIPRVSFGLLRVCVCVSLSCQGQAGRYGAKWCPASWLSLPPLCGAALCIQPTLTHCGGEEPLARSLTLLRPPSFCQPACVCVCFCICVPFVAVTLVRGGY